MSDELMNGFALLSPGAVFGGDFRIKAPLGEGGMGAVYVAVQISLDREVALKVMQPRLLRESSARKRFDREMQIVGNLRSDFIVRIFDKGVDSTTGMPWVAMELLHGQELTEYLTKRGRLVQSEVLEIFDQLCQGVQTAHEADIVHRDLKPENVFLAYPQRGGERFTVKVLDFGIARNINVKSTEKLTAGPIGTPIFMAPEQADPSMQIGPQTDVWALGLIAFYLLTGHYFWRAAHSNESNLAQLVNEAFHLPIPVASKRAAEFGCGTVITPALDAWFERCLQREPTKRYADAHQTFIALDQAINAGKKTLRQSRFWASRTIDDLRQWRLPRRGRRVASVAGVATALAVTGAVAAWYSQQKSYTDPLPVIPLPSPAISCPDGMVRIDEGEQKSRDAARALDAGFCLDVTEVTVEAYATCRVAGRCEPTGKSSNCNAALPDRSKHPVNCVNFFHASTYCEAQGKRLPTAEEWEFAARGPEGRTYPWGDGEDDLHERACWKENWDSGTTCPVHDHQRGKTPSGIFGLAGNVWEWTSTPCTDMPDCRVTKGGSFRPEAKQGLRSTERVGQRSPLVSIHGGFRCARDLKSDVSLEGR